MLSNANDSESYLTSTQRSYRDELIDPFDGASNGCNNFIVIHVSAMSLGNYLV